MGKRNGPRKAKAKMRARREREMRARGFFRSRWKAPGGWAGFIGKGRGKRSCESDATVEKSVGDIDDEVEQNENRAVNDDHAFEEKDVGIEDRIDEERACSWEIKDGFNDQRAGEEIGGERAEVTDDGEDGDFEGVFVDDAGIAEAFGSGGADEVLAENFEHTGADDPGDVGDVRTCESDGRQDQAPPSGPPSDGEPSEADGKDENEDGADDESRDADEEEGPEHGGGIGWRMLADRG